MHGPAAGGTSLLVPTLRCLHKMARMATAGPAPLDEEDDADDAGGDGVAVADGADVRLSRSAPPPPPAQVAGLPLVARPRLSAADVEVLREYLATRRQKLMHSALRLSLHRLVCGRWC